MVDADRQTLRGVGQLDGDHLVDAVVVEVDGLHAHRVLLLPGHRREGHQRSGDADLEQREAARPAIRDGEPDRRHDHPFPAAVVEHEEPGGVVDLERQRAVGARAREA